MVYLSETHSSIHDSKELVMRHMRQTWNCFTLGMVGVLTLLSFRLL